MTWFKRISLFFLVNALVISTLSFILSIFGVGHYLNTRGLDYRSLVIFCTVWGVGGSFISLLISKKIAIWTMGVKIIDANTMDPRLRRILQSVQLNAERAGLSTLPEVGIYNSPEVNAFATGPSKKNSLVALSTGLFQRLSPEEVDGVIAHEISHIANGDMVTMTLIQGIVNAFVMFLARVLAFAISSATRDREQERFSYGSHYLMVYLLETVFMFFGMMVVCWFSRLREYRADDGGAHLAGRSKMLAALQGLHRTYQLVDPNTQSPTVQTLKISSPRNKFFKLFSTHPTLEERILRLQNLPRDFENSRAA